MGIFSKNQVVVLNKVEQVNNKSNAALNGFNQIVNDLVVVNTEINSHVEAMDNEIAMYETLIAERKAEKESILETKSKNEVTINKIRENILG